MLVRILLVQRAADTEIKFNKAPVAEKLCFPDKPYCFRLPVFGFRESKKVCNAGIENVAGSRGNAENTCGELPDIPLVPTILSKSGTTGYRTWVKLM